ncbi:MAG: hypothetical protein A3D87_00380 [Omnitrophica WOR_2 bacterium RIFCSPHIGHO2_02_FULL_50_17]|nr:MAG: hypothetical protein A3D87_00380 [Omnitrophica WOR_2 bacterium RIFCSPHIGHO2_02_FULL_50_17]
MLSGCKQDGCGAWVQSANARCAKRPISGTKYCWAHYPKKDPFIFVIIGCIISILFNIFLQDPLAQSFSKCPGLHWVDKNKPLLEKIEPEIDKFSIVDKKTGRFEIIYSDKDSGVDLSRTSLKVSYKDNQQYKLVAGRLDKTKSKLSLRLDKELQYGEYLFEVTLIDKANNKTEFRKPFVVREPEDLGFTVRYSKYENFQNKEIFTSFLERHKDLADTSELLVFYLNVHNKASSAQLRDLYFSVDFSGGIIFEWKDTGSVDIKDVNAYNLLKTHDGINERVYVNQRLVNIDRIGPHGFYTVAILVGKYPPEIEEKDIWRGIGIYGHYTFEGYGSSETKKIKFELPIDKIAQE